MKILQSLYELSDKMDVRDIKQMTWECLHFLMHEFSVESVFWYGSAEYHKIVYSGDTFKGQVISFDRVLEIPQMLGIKSNSFNKESIKTVAKQLSETRDQGARHFSVEGSSYFWLPVHSMDLNEFIGGFLLMGTTDLKKCSGELQIVQKDLSRYYTYFLQFAALKGQTYQDTLTPLYNQRYLSIALDREIHRAERYNRPFSLLFFDIDNFKSVNDQHGHLTGSAIISELGVLLQGFIRESDYGFRFGGDEFVALLVETDKSQAAQAAERMRKTVEEYVFHAKGLTHQITISIGVATCPDHGQTKDEILSIADKAMYYGKRVQKNIVYVAS